MPLVDHFGLLAPVYDQALPLRNSEKLIEFGELPVSGILLDAGGGTGRVAQALRELVDSVVVADISENMLLQANQKGRLISVGTYTEYLPFADESFSRIIMIDALHHVCNHRETVNELWRVLKPGGMIVIEEPDIRKFRIKLVALAEKLAMMRSHFIDPARINELFSKYDADRRIEQDGHNAWVIVKKLMGTKERHE